MPRSLQEVLDHADELSRRFEEEEPEGRDAGVLRALRAAVAQKAAGERHVAEAVVTARNADISWSSIGAMIGTSGEAARKRYRGLSYGRTA